MYGGGGGDGRGSISVVSSHRCPWTDGRRIEERHKGVRGGHWSGGGDPGLVEHGPHDLHVLVRARHHLAVQLRRRRPLQVAAGNACLIDGEEGVTYEHQIKEIDRSRSGSITQQN